MARPHPADAPQNKPQAAKPKPRIRILATGSSIVGVKSQAEYGYKLGSLKVEDLIAAVPGLDDVAALSAEQVVNISSQDVNDQVWLTLSKRANDILKSNDVDGVVITHGTDTLEETAYFLNLVLKTDKPVVVVGSMRPATAMSADGPANLFNAVAVAASPQAHKRGVLVVMNDQIHAAREVEKMNPINVDAFMSPTRGPQGFVHSGKIEWFEPTNKRHTAQSEFDVTKLEKLPRVDILYAHANMPTDLILSAVRNGAKGIVIAGVGGGNMTKTVLQMLETEAKQDGILVVRSTRLATGPVLRNGEVNDDQMGFVASGELNPEKSRVLTLLALTKTNEPKRVQQMFNTY
jgi:L-asparaginase